MPQKAGFNHARVVSFESRMAESMAESIIHQGGQVLMAPALQEIPLEKNAEAYSFAQKLFSGQIDVMIFMTGVGIRYLIDILSLKYSLEDIIRALSSLTVVARGPKVVQTLRSMKIPVTISIPEPNTWKEILDELDQHENSISLDDRTVAIQEYGTMNVNLIEHLKKRNAKIVQVPVYRWALPDDIGPMQKAIQEIIDGDIQFVFFTSAQQVRNVLRMVAELGLEQPFRHAMRKLVISSVGSVTSEAILEEGLSVDFEPTHPKMGSLVSETALHAADLLEEKQRDPVSYNIHRSPIDIEQTRSLRKESVFIKACRREEVPYTPVWLMRQAGRYMKEYRQIRNKVPFLELCKNKELIAEVTITAVEKIKADAAIIFSDLLLIVEPLGFNLEYSKNDGPLITDHVATIKNVDTIADVNVRESLSYVFESLKLTRSLLNAKIPLIGFSGAPFTLASYIIEGGASRAFLQTKRFMYEDPGSWHALMQKISNALVDYLNAQVEAGADALQIFDSWVGILSPEDYRTFVLPHTRFVIERINKDVPLIHFGTGTSSLLNDMRDGGGDVIGIDFRMDLDEEWRKLGYDRVGVQGNLDPVTLFSPIPFIKERVKHLLNKVNNRPGHIFNLGHGVLPGTPVDHVIALVDMVHEMSQR
ncbi:MAG: uroporphyrinogen decarboxylase [Chlamydiota bacterium]|nr:uroporphyrinogen decarboxylase [Chlamydiota bacterium]